MFYRRHVWCCSSIPSCPCQTRHEVGLGNFSPIRLPAAPPTIKNNPLIPKAKRKGHLNCASSQFSKPKRTMPSASIPSGPFTHPLFTPHQPPTTKITPLSPQKQKHLRWGSNPQPLDIYFWLVFRSRMGRSPTRYHCATETGGWKYNTSEQFFKIQRTCSVGGGKGRDGAGAVGWRGVCWVGHVTGVKAGGEGLEKWVCGHVKGRWGVGG
ncbi:hypothetical protein GQ44DRAFT_477957 [Phaeosphaeriaceae sp. PMI808]|nr:hypothetical protein GQ44DRAFT_477957 [Phaeosphaeriaceae sp. PMI808]